MKSSDAPVPTFDHSSACITNLMQYIASFNAAKLQDVAEALDEQVQVYVNGKLAAAGRDTILPSYQKDFDLGKQVTMASKPKAIDECTTADSVSIQITLSATLPSICTSTTVMDVIYTYNTTTMKQTRHEITNVVVLRD